MLARSLARSVVAAARWLPSTCLSTRPRHRSAQTRKIEQFSVYMFTAVFSIWAYVWLLIILQLNTPNVIDVWEAVMTLIFFPVLVYFSYIIDTRKFHRCCRGARISVATAQNRLSRFGSAKFVIDKISFKRTKKTDYIQPREAVSLLRVLRPDTSRLTEKEIVEIGARRLCALRRSRAHHRTCGHRCVRINFLIPSSFSPSSPRTGKALKPKSRADHRNEALGVFQHHRKAQDSPMEEKVKSLRAGMQDMNLHEVELDARRNAHFAQSAVNVLEGSKQVELQIKVRPAPAKAGDLVLAYTTRDGTGSNQSAAEAGSDYVTKRGLLVFPPNVATRSIFVELIDDDTTEADEAFEVAFSLKPVPAELANAKDPTALLAKMPEDAFDWEQKCIVTILDDDLPGVLSWSKKNYYAGDDEAYISLTVNRRRGALGEVSTGVRTLEGSATANDDFMPIDEKLIFKDGQTEASLHIPLPMSRQDSVCEFYVEMYSPEGGVTCSKNGDRCTVTLGDTEEASEYMNKAAEILNQTIAGETNDETPYLQQLRNAFLVMGGDEEAGPAKWQDWVFHLLTVFWKVIYSAIPPPHWLDGYPCFFCSLAMIGLTTWVVSDVATIWSCVVGLPKSCAAITVVALGTSLPDTFASKSAAQNDPTADASVTNVTGSNSVNVFLGLGLPWTIAAIYWASIGCEFRVEASSLWYAVLIFSCNAIICVGLLFFRRKVYGGELGGPVLSKWVSSIVLGLMWVGYIVLGCIFA